MTTSDLTADLHHRIAAHGPITVADYMLAANAAYYAARDPLGAAGDFTTAPEISQMFGELVGLWCADLWQRAGRPADAAYVELGPGRGTLAADALRAMATAGLRPVVHLVETSPALRAAQAERVPGAVWHDTADSLPDDRPLLVVANEFFDALPVRQLVREGGEWRELMVTVEGEGFKRVPASTALSPSGERVVECSETGRGGVGALSSPLPPPLRSGTLSPEGERAEIMESCPAAVPIMFALSARIAPNGGAILTVDYGHDRHATGDTLQAVSRHAYADPWRNPGAHDLTAHVDFQALREAAPALSAHGPTGQGTFLRALGIDHRAAALARAAPARTEEIAAARERLTAPDQMGRLFRVMALVAPGWPDPAGFGTGAL